MPTTYRQFVSTSNIQTLANAGIVPPPPATPATTPAAHAVLSAQTTTPKRNYSPRGMQLLQNAGLVPLPVCPGATPGIRAVESWGGTCKLAPGDLTPTATAHATQPTGTRIGAPTRQDTADIAATAAAHTAGSTFHDDTTPHAAGMQVDSQGNPDPQGSDSQGGIATVSQAEVFHYYVSYYNQLAHAP